jgi:hypothetical protein
MGRSAPGTKVSMVKALVPVRSTAVCRPTRGLSVNLHRRWLSGQMVCRTGFRTTVREAEERMKAGKTALYAALGEETVNVCHRTT